MATAKPTEQFHAALAYYYDNQDEIDAELAEDAAWWAATTDATSGRSIEALK